MGYRIDFSTYDELITFVDYAQDLLLWGAQTFQLTASSGAVMAIDTTQFVTGNSRDYVSFATLRPYIHQYYINNGKDAIGIDIKLVCPEGFRQTADPDNYYRKFYVNIYSGRTTTKTINYIDLSYAENGINVAEAPFLYFCSYFSRLHAEWKVYYSREYGE